MADSTSIPHKPIPGYKLQFLEACIREKVLTFGSYTLKSGRESPYFFNAGLFFRADLVRSISTAFSQTLHVFLQAHDIKFDVLFGPAYKGIPLAVTTLSRLADLDSDLYGNTSYAHDRKEAKTHGEGGSIVGSPLKGKKVVVIDDVVTVGIASQGAIDRIRAEGGEVVALIIALDRMETVADVGSTEAGTSSAIERVSKKNGIPVVSILNLDEIIDALIQTGDEKDVEKLKAYRAKYGISKG